VGYVPFDYRRHRWAASWDWRRMGIPVRLEQLPTLYPQGSVMGRITRRASEETGIPEGLPLIASATDKASETIGAGAIDPTVACLSFGTSATVNVTSQKYIEPIFLVPPYPSAIPNQYTLEIQIYRGFWLVSWFKEQFGHPECARAESLGTTPEALFDELIRDVPPGSMGLVLQPYWTAGIKFPGIEAKGGIIGFGDVHTRAHFYKAILEGLAYAFRHGTERIEKRTRVPVERLRVTGGGALSDNAVQLTADIFGLPAERPHVRETSGLGAAINAACGLGLHSDYPSAIRAMTRVGEVIEPIWENHRVYDALYKEVFSKMYGRLKPLYQRIKDIVGYPSG
jgi:sugar (pentulose or hexulose) kinase